MIKFLRNPITIVILWWGIWGFLSIFGLSRLPVPTLKTYIILLLFIFSFWIGSLLVEKFNLPFVKSKIDESYERILTLLFHWSAGIMTILLSIVTARSLYFFSFTPGWAYKRLAFTNSDHIGFLFKYKILENLYFFVSSPLLFYLLLFGLSDFWKNKKIKYLIIAIILNSLDAFVRLARINSYLIIVLFIIVCFLSHLKVIEFLKKAKSLVFILLATFVSMIGVGVSRGYSFKQLQAFFIEYHTLGFALFDYELKNPLSSLNQQTTFGRLTLGGLETYFTILIRQFDKNYMSPALYNSINFSVNYTEIGKATYNSYYTLLYTFYSDGGFFGVFIGGFLLGFTLKLFYEKWLHTNQIINLFYVLILLIILILSIFMSQLEIMRTWSLLILLSAIYFYYSKKAEALR